MASPDTGQLVYSHLPPQERARAAPPRSSQLLPSSSAELDLSPPANHELAPSLALCVFPLVRRDFSAWPWHDTVVSSQATGTSVPMTLLQCSEFGEVKYAMYSGVPDPFSATICSNSGSRPRRALRFWQPLLPLCRTRWVLCSSTRSCACLSRMDDWKLLVSIYTKDKNLCQLHKLP